MIDSGESCLPLLINRGPSDRLTLAHQFTRRRPVGAGECHTLGDGSRRSGEASICVASDNFGKGIRPTRRDRGVSGWPGRILRGDEGGDRGAEGVD